MSIPPDYVPNFPSLTTADAKNPNTVSRVVGNMISGGLNATAIVDLTGLTSPVVIDDPRIHDNSVVVLSSEVALTGLRAHAYTDKQFTISWSAGTPGSLRYAVLG